MNLHTAAQMIFIAVESGSEGLNERALRGYLLGAI